MASGEKLKVLIAAGGTGGHLFPAIAVLEKLEKLTRGYITADFVGSSGRIEERVVPSLGYTLHKLDVVGYYGLFSKKTLSLPYKVIKSIRKCRKLIRQNKYDMVIAAGAYLSYPPGVAAHKEKIPLILMESNVSPGKVIKLLSSKADLIFTSFKESGQFFKPGLKNKIRPFGNPVRGLLDKVVTKETARIKFGLHPDKKTLLVFGGSLGARSINRAVEENIINFVDTDIQIIWQTGKNYSPPKNLPKSIKVLEFIDDMATAYSTADLVVSRSGATTVAEICALGKASILVPLPSASNNEQELNAQVLASQNAAILINDEDIISSVFTLSNQILKDDKMLSNIERASEKLGMPGAAEHCAREILIYINSLE